MEKLAIPSYVDMFVHLQFNSPEVKMPLHAFRSSLILSFLLISITIAQDVSLNDFRIRESQYQRWDVTASGSVDVRSASSGSYNYWGDNAGINLGTNFNREFNSEDAFYRLSTNINAQTSKYHYGSKQTWDTSGETSRSEGIKLITSVQYGSYILPDGGYVHTGGDLVVSQDLSRYEDYSNIRVDVMRYSKRKSVDIQWTAGIGYGKIRDARSVIVIIRILENLSEEGVLVRSLTNEEIIAMAEQYHADLVSTMQYDRRTKHLIGAIISDLMEKGLITAQRSIGYVTTRGTEVFSEQIYARPIGWRVQTGPSISFSDVRREQQNNYFRYEKDPNFRWRISAEYGTALSPHMHFSVLGDIDLPMVSWQKQLESRIVASLIHEIGERSSARVSLNWNKREAVGNINDVSASHYNEHYLYAIIAYEYLLEDNLSFNVGMQYSDSRAITEQLTATIRSVTSGGNVYFNLMYRID